MEYKLEAEVLATLMQLAQQRCDELAAARPGLSTESTQFFVVLFVLLEMADTFELGLKTEQITEYRAVLTNLLESKTDEDINMISPFAISVVMKIVAAVNDEAELKRLQEHYKDPKNIEREFIMWTMKQALGLDAD